MASERLFNFTNIFSSFEEYNEVKDELKEKVLTDFSSRKNKAKIQLKSQIVDATIGRVLINLLIMKPLVEKDIDLTEDDLFDFNFVTEGNLEKYFNMLLQKGKFVADFDDLRFMISETINEMSDLSGSLNVLAGNSVSFHDFVKLSVEDSEAEDIFNQSIDEHMQFDEIENMFNLLAKRIDKFFKDKPDSELYPFVTAETGINKKQLTQAIGFIGLKPDIDGSIIPIAIEDNYLIGLKSLTSYFINAKGTRKALITNARQVRKSGYLTRKLSLAMIDRYHDNNIEDCGTDHYINFIVTDDKMLKQINGRHYYDLDEKNQKISELNTVDSSRDSFLIGKTIGLRSPVTCASDRVCRVCYGKELSEINKDLNTGLVSVLLLTNPLTQKLLSAKHLLTTKTDKVEWGEKFLEYFSVNMNSIYVTDPEITIEIKKIPKAEQDEDEEQPYTDTANIYHNGKLVMVYNPEGDEKQAKLPRLYFDAPTSFMEDDDSEEESVILNAIDYMENEPIFTFQAKNNELIQSLQEILDLIESNTHLKIETYHGMVNKFNELLLTNELEVASVHAEMIVSVLIRDVETGKRLNFRASKLNDYKIYRVSKAVMSGPLSVALAFERLDEQLIDLATYEKDEESLMDFLYR
jgi:hypothetical protein